MTYSISEECTGCNMCAAVCPTDACLKDPDHEETEEELLAKKARIHGE